jgi:hypothetical protein
MRRTFVTLSLLVGAVAMALLYLACQPDMPAPVPKAHSESSTPEPQANNDRDTVNEEAYFSAWHHPLYGDNGSGLETAWSLDQIGPDSAAAPRAYAIARRRVRLAMEERDDRDHDDLLQQYLGKVRFLPDGRGRDVLELIDRLPTEVLSSARQISVALGTLTPDRVRAMAQHMPGLQGLHLVGHPEWHGEDVLAELAKLKGIREIILDDVLLATHQDKTAEWLRQFPELERLDLRSGRAHVSPELLDACPDITWLRITGRYGRDPLTGERLLHPDGDALWRSITRLSKLEYLALNSSARIWTYDTAGSIRNLTRLKALHLSPAATGTWVTRKYRTPGADAATFINAINELTGLRHLSLPLILNYEAPEDEPEAPSRLRHLRTLRLHGFSLSPRYAAWVQELNYLHSLDLRFEFGVRRASCLVAVQAIANLKRLRGIFVAPGSHWNQSMTDAVKGLRVHELDVSFDLRDARVSQVASFLGTMPNLTHLHLRMSRGYSGEEAEKHREEEGRLLREGRADEALRRFRERTTIMIPPSVLETVKGLKHLTCLVARVDDFQQVVELFGALPRLEVFDGVSSTRLGAEALTDVSAPKLRVMLTGQMDDDTQEVLRSGLPQVAILRSARIR